MKIYTKTGDAGDTGLFGGPRVSKAHPRIEAYGEVDELNAVLGWVRSTQPAKTIEDALGQIQHELFVIGAELATPEPQKLSMPLIGAAQAAALEQLIDRLEADLPQLRAFVLPGGSATAAALHVARTVCRRAERRVVALQELETVSSHVVIYLNRLSDLLFVMARWANHDDGLPDVPWQQPR